MQRILIIGCGGAGKSTLAKQMERLTGLPLIHLDQHYWRPNWVEPSKEIWSQQVQDLIDDPAWIMDGNYGGTMDIRIDRADTVIFLDFPTWRCLSRVVKRTIVHWRRSRPDMTVDCPERFSWQFLQYVAFYNTTRRPKILAKLARLKTDTKVLILRDNRQVKRFLHQVKPPQFH